MAKSQTSLKKGLKNVLLAAYMDTVLEHKTHPKSVYRFCETASIEEATFHFAL